MCLAIPGRLLSVEGEDPLLRTGRIDFGGIVKEANLSCVPEAKVGDYVIVHVGLAISVLDEAEAHAILDHLRAMGELDELESTGTSGRTSTPAGSPLSDRPRAEGP